MPVPSQRPVGGFPKLFESNERIKPIFSVGRRAKLEPIKEKDVEQRGQIVRSDIALHSRLPEDMSPPKPPPEEPPQPIPENPPQIPEEVPVEEPPGKGREIPLDPPTETPDDVPPETPPPSPAEVVGEAAVAHETLGREPQSKTWR